MLWVAIITVAVYLPQIFSYNTNRQMVLVKDNNCDYYDNPVFKVTPSFLQSRLAQIQPTQQVILLDNRLRKETPYYNTYQTSPTSVDPRRHQAKMPVTFFPNMTPVNLEDLRIPEAHSHEDEDEIKIDYDKLWKVGEIPRPKGVTALPDVYVRPEDAPPIVDMLSMERSELTEETHDMENVEIQEKFLEEPLSQTKEVIIERVTVRPEPSSTSNPALAMFQEIDMSKVKSAHEEKQDDDKRKQEAEKSLSAPENNLNKPE